MKIRHSHPMLFNLIGENIPVHISIKVEPPEIYWIQMLIYQTAVQSPLIPVNADELNTLSTPTFICHGNDLRNWNKEEVIFSHNDDYFLIEILDRKVSDDKLKARFVINVYKILMIQIVDGPLVFPFPLSVMPSTQKRFISLPLRELNYDYYSYLCD